MRERNTGYTVIDNRKIGRNTMRLRVEGATDEFKAPGQFVNIQIPGFTLRRPISVCDIDGAVISLVYDIVGKGTAKLATIGGGASLDILPALGNGFDISKCGKNPVLLGGGVGCPPIYSLAKALIRKGMEPTVILGFNSRERMMLIEEFKELPVPFHVATVDGSFGTKGFVTDVMARIGLNPDYFYACGPLPMLKALCTTLDIPGQVSLESRMGCGFGICVCCSVETKNGPQRICKEGPVFEKDELIWKD